MQITSTYNNYYNNRTQYSNAAKQTTVPIAPKNEKTVNSNYLHFTSWLKRKAPVENDEYGMNANDLMISLKVSDVLHQLDDESILVIGSGEWLKNIVASQLTKEKPDIKNTKKIKDIYVVNSDTEPIIVQRTDKNKFHIYGKVANLTNPNSMSRGEKSGSFFFYNYNNDAEYGDVIETEDRLKLKFMNIKESNKRMYDAKYPAESFLTKGSLNGGVVINKPNETSPSEKIEIESESPYGQKIPYRTFDDIAGMDEDVEFMKQNILYPIMYPEAFKDDITHGFVLCGEPGVGKTLLALATIGEVKKRQNKDVHFIKINSRDLERKYVGESEELWREVFDELESKQPSVLFIDEIDALMIDRDNVNDSSHNSMTSIASQLLVLFDHLEKTNAQVWVIGSTNRPNAMDAAFLRSGRLTARNVKKPDEEGCKQILDLYLKDKNISEDFDRDDFAKKCYESDFTGADINDVVNKSRNKMYKRCGIYEKMEKGTYSPSDLEDLEYTQEDFDSALIDMQESKKAFQKKSAS